MILQPIFATDDLNDMISIIICTYNRCQSLEDTLRSLAMQDATNDVNHEILVVDNNSSDETCGVVKSMISHFGNRLRYIFEARQGKSYALNRGIQESRGHILAFIDDDVVLDKDWLAIIHREFRSDKNFQILCGRVYPKNNGFRIPEWVSEKSFRSVFGLANYGDESRYLRPEESLLAGMNMTIRKEVIQNIEGFSPEYVRAEDTEFCLRAMRAGFKFYYSPLLRIAHCITANRLTREYFKFYFFESGKWSSRCKFLNNEKYLNSRNKIRGIPFWVFKDISLFALKYLLYSIVPRPQDKNEAQFEIEYLKGIIVGLRKP